MAKSSAAGAARRLRIPRLRRRRCGADGPASHAYRVRVLVHAQCHASTDHQPGTHHVLDRLAEG
ncbi:hypothetical protein OG772_17425 [Streptomyces sp. NBC_01321]|uniref:hypothetical protein n=1 Tax=Streptomyces sp. NBC_01321 TaxID=2903825 RepID=UPI002E100616|nr:hypothetical protein OG772_17425 [Streptomyces sp. NBC_01321]